MKIAVVSGGFDPVHSGHIEYLKAASTIGDKLVVCLNSDSWLEKKKGKFFLPFKERKIILENLSMVSQVIDFDDDNIGSAINGLNKVKKNFPNDKIIFCNGGDRHKQNIPEMILDDISFSFSVGGDNKKNSSSWILKEWSYPLTKRIWGDFFDLFQDNYVKVKELIIYPNQGMSLQRHFKRNELWLVSKGKCIVNYSYDDASKIESMQLEKGYRFDALINSWHQITNPFKKECRIIEIQYGEETDEDDIERLHYYNPPESNLN